MATRHAHHWLIATLLIPFLMSIAGPSIGQDPSVAVNAARERIEQYLRESAAAAGKGRLDQAVQLSRTAQELAQSTLAATDPLRVRVESESLRVQTQHLVQRGDVRAALGNVPRLRQLAVEQGNGKSNLAWAEYAHQLAENRLGANDPDRVAAFLELACLQANNALNAGNLPEARSWADRAAAAVETGSPVGRQFRLRVWNVLSTTQVRQGEGERAEAVCRRILAESQVDATDPVVVLIRLQALMMGAGLALAQGRPVSADFDAALNGLRRVSPQPREFTELLQQLAAGNVWNPLLTRARSEEDAKAAATRLAADLEQFHAALRRAGIVEAVAQLGWLTLVQFQWEQRRLDEVDRVLQRLAPTIGDPLVSPSFVGDYWNQLGLLESERANYDLARAHFETALDAWRKARLPQEALAWGNLGQLLVRQGDYEGAEQALRDAAAMHERRESLRGGVSHALALRNLSDALAGLGQKANALRLRKQALELSESARPVNHFAVYLCRNSLGVAAYQEGRFDEARAEFQRCRDRAQAAFGPEHFHVAEAEVNLGWVDLAQEKPAEAIRRFEAARTIVGGQLGEAHPRFAEILGYLGRVRAERGEREEARRLLAAALDHRERHLDRLLRSALSERDRLALVQELRNHPESSTWPGVLDTFLELAPALQIPAEEQYRRVLSWKGVLSRKRSFAPGTGAPGQPLATLVTRRKDLLQQLRSAILIGSPSDQVAALETEVDGLERRIRAADPTGGHATAVTETTPPQVAAALPPDSAMLDVIEIRRYQARREGEPVSGADSSYVGYLTKPKGPLRRIDLGNAQPIDEQVRTFIAALAGQEDVQEIALQLGRSIREPLLPDLETVAMLIVAADGQFQRLPMAALPGAKPGAYWIEDLAFAAVPTAQSFLDRRQSRNQPGATGALVVGGVDYGPPNTAQPTSRRQSRLLQRYQQWSVLPETRKEAEEVATALRRSHQVEPVELLTGKAVSKEAILQTLQRCRFAHLATHGAFFETATADSSFGTHGASAELDSFLVLAQANLDSNHGLLTAGELETLDLRGLELIVLSACQSGLGRIRAGQGMIGLSGALDRSGVHAVVSTLWSVDDASTRSFMLSYYRHLWSTDHRPGPGFALRSAQLDMIHGRLRSPNGDLLDQPHQWAGFVLNGDPYPLPDGKKTPP